MTIYDFKQQLEFSQGVIANTCEETILKMLIGCVKVEKTSVAIDKTGVDYIATLRRGTKVRIDHKARAYGCATFWKYGEPELSLEVWSVKPDLHNNGKAGWTLDESKNTDYTFHTFDVRDTNLVYLLPFQLLRMAFRRHIDDWGTCFKHGTQDSSLWHSECIFIPAQIVIKAIADEMTFPRVLVMEPQLC